jgi:hypothetical protein
MVRGVDVGGDSFVGGKCVGGGNGQWWWRGGRAVRVRICDTPATGLSAGSGRGGVARLEKAGNVSPRVSVPNR